MARSLSGVAVDTDPRIGARIASFYVMQELGRGGMSTVYLADDMRLDRKVALKLLSPELSADARFRERFVRESRIAASLEHSHIVPVFDAGDADGQLYISMRYVVGTSLRTLVRNEAPLDPKRVLEIAAHVASALDYAHARGLVHRDVKPGNVLLTREDGRDTAYLTDFGLTRPAALESAHTEVGQFVGTASYTAPEQIAHKPLDSRADVYSLGCLVYECLTGEPPFATDSLMALLWAHVNERRPSVVERRAGLPPDLDRVLNRAMARSPEDRYATCGDFVRDLRAVFALGRIVRMRRVEWWWQRWSRFALAAGVIVALTIAAAVAGVLLLRGGTEAAASPTLAPQKDSLQRIDPRANRVVATIDAGPRLDEVAAGSSGVWTLDTVDGRFARVNPTRNVAVGRGSTLGEAVALAVGFDALWIARLEGSTARSGTLLRIDPKAPGRADALTVPVVQRGSPHVTFTDLTVAADGPARGLWLASPNGLSIEHVLPLGTPAGEVLMGDRVPQFVAADSSEVWVASAWALTKIDPQRRRVVATIPLPFRPSGIALAARRVWVSNSLARSVWVVDAQTNLVIRRIRVGRAPEAVASGFGSVWVTNRADGTVSRIDPQTMRVTATLTVGGAPEDVAVGAGAVWVATHGSPVRELTHREYAQELSRAEARFYNWAGGLDEGWGFFLQRMIGGHPAGAIPPTELFSEFAVINDQFAAQIAALTPPADFAADHAQYLAGLHALGRIYRRMIVQARADHADALYALDDDASTQWIATRASVSERFRKLLPFTPLSRAWHYGGSG